MTSVVQCTVENTENINYRGNQAIWRWGLYTELGPVWGGGVGLNLLSFVQRGLSSRGG